MGVDPVCFLSRDAGLKFTRLFQPSAATNGGVKIRRRHTGSDLGLFRGVTLELASDGLRCLAGRGFGGYDDKRIGKCLTFLGVYLIIE